MMFVGGWWWGDCVVGGKATTVRGGMQAGVHVGIKLSTYGVGRGGSTNQYTEIGASKEHHVSN